MCGQVLFYVGLSCSLSVLLVCVVVLMIATDRLQLLFFFFFSFFFHISSWLLGKYFCCLWSLDESMSSDTL